MPSGPVLMISILVAFSVKGIDAGGPCHSEPCQNGGSCTAGVNDYTCNCAAGYTGKNCSVNIDDCADQPCQNGGTCIDAVNNYTCNCAAGYTGRNCSVDIDDCDDQPCQNGGTCNDAVNIYTCNCAAGYSGKNCSVAPTTLPPTNASKTCCSISVTLKKNDDNLELENKAFEKAINGFFNDSDDYAEVNVSSLELKDKEDNFDMTLKLCVVQMRSGGFLEDFFLNQVKNGKLLKTSIHENSFKCEALGVEFSDWKAKDGECKKCSEGSGGPIEIKGECEPEPGYSCNGLKNTKMVEGCLTYCNAKKSSAVSNMISTLVMAMGIALSLSCNIWE